jgi:hypothetical protein
VRSDDNLDIVVVLRRRSKGGMNNFIMEDASVIKERVARGGLAGMVVSSGRLLCHMWSAHPLHLRSL